MKKSMIEHESMLVRLHRRSNRGLTLVELLVSVSLVSILALGAAVLGSQVVKFSSQISSVDAAQTIRERALEIINSEQGWNRTISNAANAAVFNCLVLGTDCSAAPGGQFSIVDSGGLWTDHTNGNWGFDASGLPCTSYNSAAGNDACPFRLNVSWMPICAGAPCTNPEIRIVGNLEFSPATKDGQGAKINKDRFALDFVRGAADSLAATCRTLNGRFNLATRTCVMPLVGRCAFGVVLGVNTDTKEKVCGLPYSFNCPAGTVLLAVAPDGTPDCRVEKCEANDWTNPPTDDGYTQFWENDGSSDGGCDGGGDGGDGCDGGGS